MKSLDIANNMLRLIQNIEGNVQWVHKDINKMKMDIDIDKFISYFKIIANNNGITTNGSLNNLDI